MKRSSRSSDHHPSQLDRSPQRSFQLSFKLPNQLMGAFCSTLDDSNDTEHSRTTYYSPNNETFSASARKSRGPQYHGDLCDTVGMSEQLDAPTHPNPAHHYDERQQDLLESSGSLYRSAHQRRSRIRKRNQGTVKEIGRGTDGARIDLVVKDKSERKVATLTAAAVIWRSGLFRFLAEDTPRCKTKSATITGVIS